MLALGAATGAPTSSISAGDRIIRLTNTHAELSACDITRYTSLNSRHYDSKRARPEFLYEFRHELIIRSCDIDDEMNVQIPCNQYGDRIIFFGRCLTSNSLSTASSQLIDAPTA